MAEGQAPNVTADPPVLRRLTRWCVVLILLSAAAALAWVLLRRPLNLPRTGAARLIPLAIGLSPVLVVMPWWVWRTRSIRRAVRESGWRLCTHCAYDVSALPTAGTCPEGGYDVEKDAHLWEAAGLRRRRE
jgi:hypothetical protein